MFSEYHEILISECQRGTRCLLSVKRAVDNENVCKIMAFSSIQ